MDMCTVGGEVRPLSLYRVTSLAKTNYRLVTVHMYNPHVTDEAVRSFLGRYCEVTGGAKRVRDSLGFWNGRRQFQVLLQPDEDGYDGFIHPPALFALGADRGTLFYARQAPFCRRCRQAGHGQSNCGGLRCRNCQSRTHDTRDCTQPRPCHGCGSTSHYYRDCPGRRRETYAEAAGGSKPGPRAERDPSADGASGDGAGRGERTRASEAATEASEAATEASEAATAEVPEAAAPDVAGLGGLLPGAAVLVSEEDGEGAEVVGETLRPSEIEEEEMGPLGVLEEELRGFAQAQHSGPVEGLLSPLRDAPFQAARRVRAGSLEEEEGEMSKRAKGEGERVPPAPSPDLFFQPSFSGQEAQGQRVESGGPQAFPGRPEPPNLHSWASRVEAAEAAGLVEAPVVTPVEDMDEGAEDFYGGVG